ncbi:MAG TPA: hypothetical protein VKB88_03345 [Bryobacteraceae bacterium]|nr:hypothetical protein [Bryobacteraceae bacterium]
MTIPRSHHTATLLLDGRVLITGGFQVPPCGVESYHPVASAEIYDPSAGLFTPTGSMIAPRVNHVATLLPDGRVLVLGGGPPQSAEVYDPLTGTFSSTGNLPALDNPQGPAVLLNDGRVLVPAYITADLYDPSAGTFTRTGLRSVDGARAPVLQPDGNVLLLPIGTGESFAIERYNAQAGSFSLSVWPYMTSFFDLQEDFGYTAGSANLLRNGLVLITLYAVGVYPENAALLFDLSSGKFTPTSRPMNYARQGTAGTSLADGSVLITGGYGQECTAPPGAEVYDPVSDSFLTTGAMTAYRDSYTATLLKDGSVLVTGGIGCLVVAGSFTQLASAELYHPKSIPTLDLLTLSGDGQGPGAILHASTQQIVSSANPAVPGEYLEIYLRGLIDGSAIPPQVTIGGRMAEVSYFGAAPGYPGLSQVNVRVPAGIPSGPTASVYLIYLGRPSNEVAIAVE